MVEIVAFLDLTISRISLMTTAHLSTSEFEIFYVQGTRNILFSIHISQASSRFIGLIFTDHVTTPYTDTGIIIFKFSSTPCKTSM